MVRIVCSVILLFLTLPAFSQRVVANTFFFDVDEPPQRNTGLAKSTFRILKMYSCPDSVFNNNSCNCTKIEYFNDSGEVKRLISGSSIEKGKIDYEIRYTFSGDSFCESLTEFYPAYIDSVELFKVDSVIKGKARRVEIFPRQKNGRMVVRSVFLFSSKHTLPDEVRRYDTKGILREISYPLGNRIPRKEWTDTLVTDLDSTITFNQIFKENTYNSSTKFSRKGTILESSYTNHTFPDYKDYQRTIYMYDDSARLVFKYSLNANNSFINSVTYKYEGKYLVAIHTDNNLFDAVDNEIKKYDIQGNVIDWFQRSNYYDKTWRNIYSYKNGLQSREDYYYNNEYQKSTFFIYE